MCDTQAQRLQECKLTVYTCVCVKHKAEGMRNGYVFTDCSQCNLLLGASSRYWKHVSLAWCFMRFRRMTLTSFNAIMLPAELITDNHYTGLTRQVTMIPFFFFFCYSNRTDILRFRYVFSIFLNENYIFFKYLSPICRR
jgi:uncharacterized C2H2 Zn-finger protein